MSWRIRLRICSIVHKKIKTEYKLQQTMKYFTFPYRVATLCDVLHRKSNAGLRGSRYAHVQYTQITQEIHFSA